jgi:periplasmic divalent cation tolerance protein
MQHPTHYCMILSTCPDIREAEKLALALIENKLAACVQITGVTSFYEWDRKVNRDTEQLLIIKAKKSLYPEIEAFISKHHSYDVPEIIEIPIGNGLNAYFNWIDAVSK